MQPDLFTPPNPRESKYADDLASLVQAEEDHRIDHGIVPNWIESDFLIAKDERRLLTLVADAAGYVMRDGDYVVTPYGDSGARRVSRFTVDMAMNAEANSKAVLNAAVARGLITVTRDNEAPGMRLDMTRRGQYYLDLCETNDYWESEESDG